MTIKRLLGSAPSQVSTNKNLGDLAFQNADGIVINGGTATLAGVTVNGSTIPTNGVYLPATNTVAISTNSTERVRVDALGKVGINRTPTTVFDVETSGNGSSIRASAGNAYLELVPVYGTGASYIDFIASGSTAQNARISGGVGSSSNLVFSTGGASVTEKMRIFSSGGVSIGNTTDRGAGNLNVTGVVITGGYTVATLPTGVVGMRAYVTNALTPTYGSAVVGGGSVTIPVFYNGTAWITA